MQPPARELILQSNRVRDHILRRIAANRGWIGFDEFMHTALHAPALGYYATGRVQFGARGDFVTAPMLGDVAARCLARQCAEVLAQIGGGDVIEFGAGDGQLAVDVLTAMRELGQSPRRYCIIETSPALIARQRATIGARMPDRVEWLAQLPRAGFTGAIIANEVLDAMPVTRFEINANGAAVALGVGARDARLHWQLVTPDASDATLTSPLPARLQSRITRRGLPPGYRGEINPRAEAWVRSVGAKLNRGALFIIDYGYPRREFYHPERRAGTLMCFYRGHAHDDPFFYPGLQDITAHIDFTAVARAAAEVGLQLAGFTSQGAFLLASGALDELQHCAAQQPSTQVALTKAQEIKTLTLPGGMGEIIKVIAFTRNCAATLSGFAIADRRATLKLHQP